jgi:hypothetical protein
MPDLNFRVEKAEAVPFAAAPQLNFRLRIAQPGGPREEPASIHTIALRCQIHIEPARRRYAPKEQDRLADLFGTRDRWGQTLKTMFWTHASVGVPAFTGETAVDLPVPCTYDFNVAATKYFYGLEEGQIPLSLLFSGTIFYESEEHGLQVAQLPWEKEATFKLPVHVWKDMMDHYYPNSAWLCLRQDIFDRLYEYKRRHGLPTWEQALEKLLAEEAADAQFKHEPAGPHGQPQRRLS